MHTIHDASALVTRQYSTWQKPTWARIWAAMSPAGIFAADLARAASRARLFRLSFASSICRTCREAARPALHPISCAPCEAHHEDRLSMPLCDVQPLVYTGCISAVHAEVQGLCRALPKGH